jgi:hypothetical protein
MPDVDFAILTTPISFVRVIAGLLLLSQYTGRNRHARGGQQK